MSIDALAISAMTDGARLAWLYLGRLYLSRELAPGDPQIVAEIARIETAIERGAVPDVPPTQ